MSENDPVEVPFHRPDIGEAEIAEVVDSLRSGWLTTGPKVKRFEAEFAEYIGKKHAVALNSCTAGLHLALEAIGIGPGDGVLVPTHTFAATAEVVRYLGAEPVFADCRESDLNLDPDSARAAIAAANGRGVPVKAIIPMHYGGQMVDMAAVSAIAAEFSLKIVEDAAHCCPAFYREGEDAEWEPVGRRSDVAAFSFYANKTITTGEGGMALTDDEDLAHRMRVMSLHGMDKDAWKRFSAQGSAHYDIVAPGFKYNMTDLAAAIGVHQLARADALHRERGRIADRYAELLSGVEEVRPLARNLDRVHSWHLFVVRIDLEKSARDRDGVAAFLRERRIGSSIHWRPLHMQTYYRETYGYGEEDFPVARRVFDEILTLPLWPGMSGEQIEAVAAALKEAVQGE